MLMDKVRNAGGGLESNAYQPHRQEQVRLSDIRLTMQSRMTMHENMIVTLAARIAAGKSLDPPVVYLVDGEMILVKGYHRVEAFRREGHDVITVQVVAGTADDAFDAAMSSNTKHGTPLTPDDYRYRLRLWYHKKGVARAANEAARGTGALPQLAAEVQAKMMKELGQEDTGQRVYERGGREIEMKLPAQPFARADQIVEALRNFVADHPDPDSSVLSLLKTGDAQVTQEFRATVNGFRVRTPTVKVAARTLTKEEPTEELAEEEPTEELTKEEPTEELAEEEPTEEVLCYSAAVGVWAQIAEVLADSKPELWGRLERV